MKALITTLLQLVIVLVISSIFKTGEFGIITGLITMCLLQINDRNKI